MVETTFSKEEPLNREPPISTLIETFFTPARSSKSTPTTDTNNRTADSTPSHSAYDRNHGPIPYIDASKHKIKVTGNVANPLELSVDDLKAMMDGEGGVEVVCALQCAGNRRHTMRTQLKEVSGVDWGDAAIMNCVWRGVRLRDILLRAGIDHELAVKGEEIDSKPKLSGKHVAFACYQVEVQDDKWYGGSIELWRAMDMDRDVILALEMNGAPIEPSHGAPVRVIVPGVAGARSVKWLDEICVQDEESSNFYQRHDYKVLPEEVESMEQAEGYWDKVPAFTDMPTNSVIGLPEENSAVMIDADRRVLVKGYAVPQGADGPVVKVEVSGDEGKTWIDARLRDDKGRSKWSWVLWEAKVTMELGEGKIIYSRATDRAGNEQGSGSWNLRGVGYNGYGEVRGLTVLKSGIYLS